MNSWLRKAAHDYSTISKNLGMTLAALAVAGLAAVYAVNEYRRPAPDLVTPAVDRFGWAGQDQAKADWKILKHEFAPFEIKGATESTAGKRVVLWDLAKKVNGGKHLPTLRQQVGSCVGHGITNAIWYLQAVQIALLNERHNLILPYEPALYSFSREELGWQISGDGSTGSAAAAAVKSRGVVRSDLDGLPAWTTTEGRLGVTISFPGSIDRKWGRPPGVPEVYRQAAAQHLVKTIAKVTTYEQIRDAIANGYPVTIACNQGFDGGTKVDGGKRWGIPRGSWPHQMCFIGVDDEATRKGCYCLNSWGAEAHDAPADDAPPGGFWVDADIVTRMARDEAFAISSFVGFPSQDLDWNVIRARLGAIEPDHPEDN